MAYRDSAIWQDGVDLITTSKGWPGYRLQLELITEVKTIQLSRIIQRSTVRDFVGNKFDAITASVECGMGTWLYDIFPHRANLKAKLKVIPVRRDDPTGAPILPEKVYDFKVILEDSSDSSFANSNEATASKTEGDSTKNIVTNLTLIRDTDYELRLSETYGWYLRTSLTDLISSTLLSVGKTQSPTKDQYNDEDFKGVVGVDIIPIDNKQQYDTIQVMMGTRLPRIGNYLQDKYGLYNNGAGSYLHKGIWYVYPITDFGRFQTSKRRLAIYNLPKDKMYGIETTFTFKGDELNIIAGGDVKATDRSELMQVNTGNVIKLTNSKKVFNDFLNVNDDGTLTASKSGNMSVGAAEQRKDGIYNPMSEIRISTNQCKALSELNRGKVQEYHLQWHNSAAEHIVPGMPCRIFYNEGGETKSIDGIVAGIQESDEIGQAGINSGPMSTNSVIRILGERR